jgi:hypothetical protein
MLRKVPLAWLVLLAGCTLYSEVAVVPLNLLPTNIERGSDLQSMLRKKRLPPRDRDGVGRRWP